MDEAPRTKAVSAPLPDELRPYIVLHAENAALPNGSRFGGHWVNAWRCRLPFVQIDRARSHAVGRCVPFADDRDPDRMRQLLRDAACLIAADETWLAEAADEGTPTIYLADGHPDATSLPDAIQAFDADRLRVLRSGTNFRRDLPLRLVNEALEHFVPGVTGEDRSESSLCRDRLAPYLKGRIADLGHGGHKVHPDAVGVDFFKFDETDWIGDVRDLWFFASQSFDSVYSSHCLEDLWQPHQALEEWTRILRCGGELSLFLPLRDFYPNVGTPGANPGHKDDYVPEDVEGFLRDLGHMEIVHSARVEPQNSFEVVARKQAGRSYFFQREQLPKPVVSAMIVVDPSYDPQADAAAVRATVAAAQAALSGVAHEVLVLDRTRCDGDGRAAVRELAAADARVHVVEDRRPLPYAQRYELLRRIACGDTLLVVQNGTMLAEGAGAAMLRRLQDGAEAAVPMVSDPLGRCLVADAAVPSCLMLQAACWPVGALDDSPFGSRSLWRQLARRCNAVTVADARAIGVGDLALPATVRGIARSTLDEQLAAAGRDPREREHSRSILVVMLRTLGDCVLATPVLEALRRRHPQARIEVLTERPYAWIFEQDEAVDAVLTTEVLAQEQLALAEDRVVTSALESGSYDRLVLLSDRLENVTYHHSGVSLADYYALQAGVPEACARPPRLSLSEAVIASCAARRQASGIESPYAVVHTRAGWAEKSPSPELCQRIVGEIAAAGMTPVVIGGPGEGVDDARACNLAGELSMAESAAVIAGAEVFVGPDSGPLHIASAFGIPSLALFGGSHLRVAPPRAAGSCSVQAASCCPVPCGVTPCPERNCGAAGLRAESVLPRLAAVIAGDVDQHGEYWGSEPALCVQSADGPSLVQRTEQQFGGAPVAAVPAATTRAVVTSRAESAPVQALPVELGMFALEGHRRRIVAPLGFEARLGDCDELLESLRASVTPEAGLDVVRQLAAQCQAIAEPAAVLQSLAAAIAHCGAMVRGERGRPRPAFRLHAEELLHRALHVGVGEPAGTQMRMQLLDLYEAEFGRAPELEHVLNAVQVSDDRLLDSDHRRRLHDLLCGHLGEEQRPHAQVLRLASMLRRLQDNATAIAVLDAELSVLPSTAVVEAAEVRFLRGTCHVAEGRPEQALLDMRFASDALSTERDRKTAAQIVTRLEQHLARPTIDA